MDQNREALYAAFQSKDPRFDGRFFVGVTSTGIYCRPICRARLPRPENCTYFATAAEAEGAGFRPCLQCRPELAPGFAPVDAAASLARRAAREIEDHCGIGGNLSALADRLGCTDRHLRRVFAEELHVSPIQYLQTCRLLLAKSLLTDTGLSVLDVAMASGFGSLRRFNDVFKRQYRLTPTALRRQAAATDGRADGSITLALGYRPPYQWERILNFFAPRSIPGVEQIQDNAYMRTVQLTTENGTPLRGWIRVNDRPEKSALAVTLSASLLPALPQVLSRVRRLFDLHCEPAAVQERLSRMDELRPGLFVPGIRLPGCFDSFETSVRAVLGQQITVKAATTLAGRLVKSFGCPIQTGVVGLTHTFPLPEVLLQQNAGDRLGSLGVIASRAETIRALAARFERGQAMEAGLCARPEEAVQKLLELPGVGPWTAHYIAMRALGWTDAFPDTDLGVKKALAPRGRREILSLAENWRPWRAYAVMCLWNAE